MALNYLDYSQYPSEVKAIFRDVFLYDGTGASPTVFGYYWATSPVAPFTGNKIQGFYFDLFGGGGGLSQFQLAPSIDPNGAVATWELTKADFASYLRGQMRGEDPDFYTSTENCEEGLIGVMDFHHMGGIGESPSPTDWGALVGGFGIVYSRYQCMFDLSIALNDACFTTGSPSTQAAYYTCWLQASFHYTGGHLALHNQARGDGSFYQLVPIEPASIANCPMLYMLVWTASMIAAMNATPAIKRYMHGGFKQRPLPASWEGDYVESGQMLATYVAFAQNQLATFYYSSVWMNPDADADFLSTDHCIGIIITGAATEPSTTYNIYMQAEAYDLSPTTVKALYSRVGAVRTELTRFTDVLDYDVEVEFGGVLAPCDLYEIVTL